MLIHTILIYICYSPGFFIFIFYIGKIHTVLFLLYIQMFPRIFIIIINNPTIIIFMHITFSIFWILSSERFPEVKLLSQRAQILLWPFKDIAKMLFKRSLPTYNEFKDIFFFKKNQPSSQHWSSMWSFWYSVPNVFYTFFETVEHTISHSLGEVLSTQAFWIISSKNGILSNFDRSVT